MKRAMDICGSIALLIALFIPMMIIAILIKLGSEGPIIYHSKRIGQFGKPFNFLKFRSMYINSKEIEAKMLQEWDEKAAEISLHRFGFSQLNHGSVGGSGYNSPVYDTTPSGFGSSR